MQAEDLASRKDRLLPEDTRNQKMCEPEFHSIIERERGNSLKAVELLAPVMQYEQDGTDIPYERARAYLSAVEYAKAEAEFAKILRHRGWREWEIFAPLSQLGRARAYAMQGDRDNGRKAYDEFFATWKNADPEIPILRQAKEEYKKMAESASGAGKPQVTAAN